MNRQHAYCKIILSGPLTERWADYVGDLLVDTEVERGQIQTTTLIGRPCDLSAYIGMLTVLTNLGHTVIATEYQQAPANETAATDSTEPAHG